MNKPRKAPQGRKPFFDQEKLQRINFRTDLNELEVFRKAHRHYMKLYNVNISEAEYFRHCIQTQSEGYLKMTGKQTNMFIDLNQNNK